MHGLLSALTLVWAQPLFVFELHGTLFDSCREKALKHIASPRTFGMGWGRGCSWMLLCSPFGSGFCLIFLVSPGPSSQLPAAECVLRDSAFHSHAVLGAAFGTSSVDGVGLASPGVCP